MKRITRFTLASALAVAMLIVPGMLAAAKELSTLTISGRGISGMLALHNAQGLAQLEQYGFFGTTTDTSTLARAPQNLGEGYTVTGYLNLDGKAVPFAQGIYYPAVAGEQGYIHFTGAFNAATMQLTKADRWAIVSPAAAAALSSMVAAEGVTLQPAVGIAPLQSPASLPAMPAPQAGSMLPALIVAGASVVAAGFWMKKRQAAVRS